MSILGSIRQWHLSRQRRNILNTLPDHILSDIGFERFGRKIELRRHV